MEEEDNKSKIIKLLFGKISNKLSLMFAVLIFFVAIMSITTILFQQSEFENRLLESVKETDRDFSTLTEGDTRMLSVALGVFTQNKEFKDVYLEMDREKLFDYGQPLFQQGQSLLNDT